MFNIDVHVDVHVDVQHQRSGRVQKGSAMTEGHRSVVVNPTELEI